MRHTRAALVAALWITITAAAAAATGAGSCVGDCGGDGTVEINELITAVNIVLGNRPIDDCPALACGGHLPNDFVACAVAAVDHALRGCPTATATPPPTVVVTPGVTPSCTLTRIPTFTRIGTRTPTPTPSASCTPGDNPAPGCLRAGPTFTATSSPCHGSTPTPEPPDLLLEVHASSFPAAEEDGPRIEVVATIQHLGGPPVTYLDGCTTICRPSMFVPIDFSVAGPDGAPVLIDDTCRGRYLCGVRVLPLTAGESRTESLSLTGTALDHQETYPGECFTDCAQRPLVRGRYIVTARFYYGTGSSWPIVDGTSLTATVAVDWPPAP